MPSRTFFQARPGNTENSFYIHHPPYSTQKFKPLPKPTGKPPYHLTLEDVLGTDSVKRIQESGRIVFHTAGDTGGVKDPDHQRIVAFHMEEQFQQENPVDRPAFFYHLGDVVYYFGESVEYGAQFYDPYL